MEAVEFRRKARFVPVWDWPACGSGWAHWEGGSKQVHSPCRAKNTFASVWNFPSSERGSSWPRRRNKHDPSVVSGRPGDGTWSAFGTTEPGAGYGGRG